MITIMLMLAGAVAVLAIIGVFAVKRVSEAEVLEERKKFKPDDASASEWSNLSTQYNPDKAYDVKLSDSDGFRLCKDFLDKATSQVENRCGPFLTKGVPVQVKNLEMAEALDIEKYLKNNFDAEDIMAMYEGILTCAEIGRDLTHDQDCACVAAYDSKDRVEQMKCREMLENAFGILDPTVLFSIYYKTPDGRSGLVKKHATLSVLANIAKMPDYSLDMSPRERAKALAKDGYRCRVCGRSPLSGGILMPVWTEYTQRYEAMCDNCHHEQ